MDLSFTFLYNVKYSIYCECSLDCLLFVLMNSPIHIDTIMMGWSILYLLESHAII